MHNCNCQNNFCELRNKTLTERQFQCCQGTSGLPEWKEQYYLAILDGNTELAEKIKKKNSSPNLVQQATNFAGAMVNYALDGFKNVSDEVYAERLKVCDGCEYLKENKVCSKCGCNTRFKARIASSECPLKKWLRE